MVRREYASFEVSCFDVNLCGVYTLVPPPVEAPLIYVGHHPLCKVV